MVGFSFRLCHTGISAPPGRAVGAGQAAHGMVPKVGKAPTYIYTWRKYLQDTEVNSDCEDR